ncbi:MAG: hypothetical protein WA002_05410 [Candidatus Acidiferrales bacterium]
MPTSQAHIPPQAPHVPGQMNPSLGAQQVTPIGEQDYTPKPEATPPGNRVAVIVIHGVGEQVPYETLEGAANAVWRAAGNSTGDPELRHARLGAEGRDIESELSRVEITIRDRDDHPREVHFYECYWAPLTEGKVSIANVISFLLGSGLDGIANTTAGVYKRWMFGAMQQFNLKRLGLYAAFLSALLLVGSLIAINAVAIAAAASQTIAGNRTFPGPEFTVPLTSDFIVADFAALLIALGTFLLPWLAQKLRGGKLPPPWLGTYEWILVIAGATLLTLVGYVILLRLIHYAPEGVLWPFVFRWATWLAQYSGWLSAIWGFEVLAAAAARWVLVEYAGDVAAYVSATAISQFWKLRQEIWNTAMQVARAVYRARTADGSAFLYPHVVVVGHSLGTVIGYDVLNGMMLEDAFSAHALDIAQRTRMFLTFGSPLDKTAFIFRTQKDANSNIREVASAAVQPMIVDYAHRPQEWVNLWSPADVISGSLEYYDPANVSLANPQRVVNLKDPEARTPLAAHVEYWNGQLFARELYRAIST